jgi:hypothetical protein
MIDWYMLLAPLVALPIVLLFAFVGTPCVAAGTSLDDPEFLFDGQGTVGLEFTIPKKNPKLNAIRCAFQTPGHNPITPPELTLSWSGSFEQNLFEPIFFDLPPVPRDWTCSVQLIVDGQQDPQSVKPGEVVKDRIGGDIRFKMVYDEFPSAPSPTYDFNLFRIFENKF